MTRTKDETRVIIFKLLIEQQGYSELVRESFEKGLSWEGMAENVGRIYLKMLRNEEMVDIIREELPNYYREFKRYGEYAKIPAE